MIYVNPNPALVEMQHGRGLEVYKVTVTGNDRDTLLDGGVSSVWNRSVCLCLPPLLFVFDREERVGVFLLLFWYTLISLCGGLMVKT